MKVDGFWRPEWSPVVDAFAANFTDAGEDGAGVAIYHRGELMLNIWAGERDNRLAGIAKQPWEENTLVNIFSAGKGLVALCILQLVAQEKLNLDVPVANYWPEFAGAAQETVQSDKSAITVRHILCHRSGLSAFHARISDEQIFNWDSITAIIAAEYPWWTPDSAQGYSPFMFGWILGELVKRASGYASFNEYFQIHVAQPLEINCHFGVSDDSLASIADVGPLKRPLGTHSSSNHVSNGGADSVALGKLMKADPRGVTNRAFSNPMTLMTASNTQAWRQAQIPAANAHTNAYALARIYSDLAVGNNLLPANILSLCSQQQTFGHDQVLGLPLRFSCGFMLSQADRSDCRYGRGERAFGHPGAGGCVGFADPDYALGFGYVTRRMGQGLLIDERAVRLIDAAYGLLGDKK